MINKHQRLLYTLMATGGLTGLVASFWQLLDKLQLLQNKSADLICNINSAFGCSNILNAPQSSVFGFPNSLMCTVLFTIMLVIGIVGLTGSVIAKNLKFALQFFALFMMSFGLWYLFESIFRVGTLCIFCIFCFAGVLLINFAWLRLNYQDYPVNKKQAKKLARFIKISGDIFLWCIIALIVITWALVKFY